MEGASKKRRGGVIGGGGGGGGSLASSTRKDKGLSVDFKESQVRAAMKCHVFGCAHCTVLKNLGWTFQLAPSRPFYGLGASIELLPGSVSRVVFAVWIGWVLCTRVQFSILSIVVCICFLDMQVEHCNPNCRIHHFIEPHFRWFAM